MDLPVQNDLCRLYDQLDAEVAAAGPQCQRSGRCCRFTEFGHTLFLSKMEADLLFQQALPENSRLDGQCCPYQVENSCLARPRRALGCRVYFCDSQFADWLGALSEKYIRQLKALHEIHRIQWDYRPLNLHLQRLLPEAPASIGHLLG